MRFLIWCLSCGAYGTGDYLVCRYKPKMKWWYRFGFGSLLAFVCCKLFVEFRTFPKGTSVGEITDLSTELGKVIIYKIV